MLIRHGFPYKFCRFHCRSFCRLVKSMFPNGLETGRMKIFGEWLRALRVKPCLLPLLPPRRSSTADRLYLATTTIKTASAMLGLCLAEAAGNTVVGIPESTMKCRGAETGAAGGDRTHDPWLRRPILYPLSYSRVGGMVRRGMKDTGFPGCRPRMPHDHAQKRGTSPLDRCRIFCLSYLWRAPRCRFDRIAGLTLSISPGLSLCVGAKPDRILAETMRQILNDERQPWQAAIWHCMT